MKPVLETVVRSRPAVCSPIPSPSSTPSTAPAAKPERPSVSTRRPPTTASTPVAIAYRIARNANSG